MQELLAQYSERRTRAGNAGILRNGYLPERELQTGVGPVTVKIPKIRAKTGEPLVFRSALVPPYVRKTRSLEATLSWLPLKGVSNGKMSEAVMSLAPLIVTPHTAWASHESRQRLLDGVATNIQAYLSGDLLNRIEIGAQINR